MRGLEALVVDALELEVIGEHPLERRGLRRAMISSCIDARERTVAPRNAATARKIGFISIQVWL